MTGWTVAQLDETPFADAIKLFAYWSDYPPVHLLVREYLGFQGKGEINPMETAAAIQLLTAGGGATKLSQAPTEVRGRFEQLKEQMTKGKK